MVSGILIALALIATPAADSGSTTHAEARVTATIEHAVTLQSGTATARSADIVPAAQKPRDCGPTDKPAADCRLIVYDLP